MDKDLPNKTSLALNMLNEHMNSMFISKKKRDQLNFVFGVLQAQQREYDKMLKSLPKWKATQDTGGSHRNNTTGFKVSEGYNPWEGFRPPRCSLEIPFKCKAIPIEGSGVPMPKFNLLKPKEKERGDGE